MSRVHQALIVAFAYHFEVLEEIIQNKTRKGFEVLASVSLVEGQGEFGARIFTRIIDVF